MHNLNDTPEECIPCDPVCEPLESCPNGLCYSLPVVYITAFAICGILLSIRLYLFFKYVPYPRWSLKKLLFLCGVLTCFLRVLRNVLLVAGLPFKSAGLLLLDAFVYFYAFLPLFSMYSLLLIFWANMLQKNKTPRSWINKQMKILLVGMSIGIFVVMTALPITAVLSGINAVAVLFNAIFLVMVLFITITMSVEGYRVMKLIKNMEIASHSTSNEVLQTITKLVIGSSIILIITMVVLIITTLIRVRYPNSVIVCMVSHAIYRTLELTVICVLAYPLRGFETKTPTSTSLNFPSQVPSRNSKADTSITIS
mmetsp:Transcript_11876/g.16458  ORF Transcript_11876/g.16458 Transcript_11876/m.16458 type:complete len:311 (-) Transcript_11876:27-959(-)